MARKASTIHKIRRSFSPILGIRLIKARISLMALQQSHLSVLCRPGNQTSPPP